MVPNHDTSHYLYPLHPKNDESARDLLDLSTGWLLTAEKL